MPEAVRVWMHHGGYRRDAPGCVMVGLGLGAYWVGCCRAPMALLLVAGVMNALWIVLLASLAFLEWKKSTGLLIARLIGMILVAGGVSLFSLARLDSRARRRALVPHQAYERATLTDLRVALS